MWMFAEQPAEYMTLGGGSSCSRFPDRVPSISLLWTRVVSYILQGDAALYPLYQCNILQPSLCMKEGALMYLLQKLELSISSTSAEKPFPVLYEY